MKFLEPEGSEITSNVFSSRKPSTINVEAEEPSSESLDTRLSVIKGRISNVVERELQK